jgi:hypothetical protein
VQEIAFPYQCELKVNGGEIKANLRGLKNRPGSTRPVDITTSLRLKQSGYTNNVELTYALTQRVREDNDRTPRQVRTGKGAREGLLTSCEEILHVPHRLPSDSYRDSRCQDQQKDSQIICYCGE